MKVTAQEVKETLESSDEHITIAELARLHGVTPDTIRNKIRTLRNDGDPIIHGQDGIFLLSKSNLEDAEIAQEFALWIQWHLSIVKALCTCAEPVRHLFPTMKKTLAENTSSEERKRIGSMCVRVKALVDHVEAYEEIGS